MGYQAHFTQRDVQQLHFKKDLTDPEADTLYIHTDAEEPREFLSASRIRFLTP